MPSLRDCIGLAGKLLHPADGEALLARAKQAQADGHSAKDAERMAVDHHIGLAETTLKDVIDQAGKAKPETKRELTPLEKRASDVYKAKLAKHGEAGGSDIWHEQMREQIENPSRYHPVKEDENPKGLKIGDRVTIKSRAANDPGGTGTVVSVEKTAATTYGGYSVKVAHDAKNYGGIYAIDRVEKGGTPETKHGEIEGDKINKEWTQFGPDTKGLGIPRAEMPQVHAEHRGALVNFLKGKGIDSQITEVKPTQLKPTQNEYSPAKVEKARKFEGGDRSILVSSDNYVVDGHHQWVAALHDRPGEPMKVIRIDAPIKELLPIVHDFPSTETAGGKPETSTVAIKRGENSPQRLMKVALDAAKLAPKEAAATAKVIAELGRRLEAAAPAAFKDMEVHVMSDAQWQAHEDLSATTPDSAAAYDQDTNTLYLNSGRLNAENLAVAVVHESGHFAETILGKEFTQQEWESLTDEQRQAAAKQYDPENDQHGSSLLKDRRARSEWFAMQFTRVVRGDTKGMSDRMKAALGKLLEMIRSVVKKWLGDESLTTAALDKKIVEMMGYEGKSPTSKATKPAPLPTKPREANKPSAELDKLAGDLFGSPAEPGKFNKKFDPEKIEAANKFVAALVREHIEVRTKGALAQFLRENYPKAVPYSESIFRIMESFADVNTEGTFGEQYAKQDVKEVRDLITSDNSKMGKAVQMRQMAERRGLTLKDMQEHIEAELTKMVNENAQKNGDDVAFTNALDLYEKQPLFSARTSTSVENQAYSTPAPLAIALKHMTGVTPKSTLYEPTAGNGMLMVGADLAHSEGNELNPGRADALRELGVSNVRENDAKTYVPPIKFDVVHANPPFGSIDNVNYDGSGIRKLEHLISLKALEAMKDNGTAALILGANMTEGPTARGAQWVFENYLYGHYNVVDNFEVSGDLYGNQGAKWPVRIIAIAGRKANPATGDFAPKQVDRLNNWDQVWDRAEKVANATKAIRDSLGAGNQPGTVDRPSAGGEPAERPGSVSTQGGRGVATPAGRGEPGGNRGGQPANSLEPVGRPDVAPPAGADIETAGSRGASDDTPAVRKPAAGVERVGGEGPGKPGAVVPGGSTGAGKPTVPGKLPGPVSLDQKQIPYVPRAEGEPFGTLTPTAIGVGTHAALDKLVAKVGPLAEYVADKLNTTPDRLREGMSADQIDGAALLLHNIDTGGALIIGDQTGIGKGRQAAAGLVAAKMAGKVGVFFTADPKLFSDMHGDVKDIGGKLNPLIFGNPDTASIVDGDGNVITRAPSTPQMRKIIAKIKDEGWEKSGYDSIFITYSQINVKNERQAFLEHLADDQDIFLIMDEAHLAAGNGETSMQAAFLQGGKVKRGKGATKTTVSVPGLLNAKGTQKGRGGVGYLSATYAKRPDNMPLYFRTALGQAAENFSDVVRAMKSGGIALQQAISEALAQRGQYIRRERDFSGTKYTQKTVGVERKAELTQQIDQVTDILSQIVKFSKRMKEAVQENPDGDETSTAMSEAAHSVTDFASVVHNQIGQLLLSAKADEIVKEALAAHAQGEKPVIGLMNTMESFLGKHAGEEGLKHGDKMTLNWQTLLKNSLDSMLRVTTKEPNGDTTITQANPEHYGLKELYDSIIESIGETDIKFPTSPIDYIQQKLAAAGVKMGELTGRQSGITYTNFDTGEGTYRKFKTPNKNSMINGFNRGDHDGLITNLTTGYSAHAAPKFKDTRPRHMIIAQAAHDINAFLQLLGRILRTGMIPGSAQYTHLMLPLQSEMRPAAMTNQKMKSLNANTTSDAESGVNVKAVNMLNKYGDEIVTDYLDSDPELQATLNMDVERNQDDRPKVEVDTAKKFTGRMALLPDSRQKGIYDTIYPLYNEHLDQLRATGDYDLDIITHTDWDGVKGNEMQLEAGKDESDILTASVKAQNWEITDTRKVPTGEDMQREFQKNTGGVEKFREDWQDFRGIVRTRQAKNLAQKEEALANATAKDRAKKEGDPTSMAVKEAEIGVNGARIDIAKWANTERILDGLFARVGQPVSLFDKESGQREDGMMVGVKFPDHGEDDYLRVSPSRFQLRYLVNTPGGRMYIAASQFAREEYRQDGTYKQFSDFQGRHGSDRYNRWVVTGNPIAAYKATGGKGKMVRFKSREGQVITGLLMKNNWNVNQLANDSRYKFKHGQAATDFLLNQGQYGRQYPIVSKGNVARIASVGGYGSRRYSLSVPSAKNTGALFFLDPALRKILGDFNKVGNRMLAEIPSTADIPKIADRIAKLTGEQMRADGTGEELLKQVNKANGVKDTSGGTVGTPAEEEPMGPLGTPFVKQVQDTLSTLHKEITELPKYSGFNKVLNTWVGNRQIGIGRTERTVKAVMKAIPKKLDREAVMNWAEAGGDATKLQAWADGTTDSATKAAYEKAMNLSPEQEAMGVKIKKWFDDQHARAVNGGVMKQSSFIQDYITHIVDRPFVGGGVSGSGGKTAARFKFAQKRTFPTSFDLEQAGYKLKTKDVAHIMAVYGTHLTNAIETRRLAKSLLSEKNDAGESLGKLILGQYKTDVSPDSNFINDPSAAREGDISYKPVQDPAFKGWAWKGMDPESGKAIIMQGEIGLHPDIRSQLENAIGRSEIRQWYDKPGSLGMSLVKGLVKSADITQSTLKGTMLGGISGFHAVHEIKRAGGNRVVINPVLLKPIDWNDPRTQMMVRAGVMLAGDYDATKAFSEGLGSRSLVDKIPGIGKVSQAMADYTFHQLIPSLKWHTFNAVFERNLQTLAGMGSPEDIAYLTAKQINARFGHLNLADMNIDPTFWHAMSGILLAPDFLTSNLLNYAQDVKGAAGAKTGREPIKALLFTAGMIWILARILNNLTDDDPHYEEPFGVIHKNRRYTMRNEAEDLWNLAHDTTGFLMARLNPSLASTIQLGTKRNWRGEKSSKLETLKDWMMKWIPISGRGLTGKLAEVFTTTGATAPISPWEEFAASQGVRVSRVSKINDAYRLAGEYMDKHGQSTGEGSYPVSQYQKFRYALEDGNVEQARKEAAKLIKAATFDPENPRKTAAKSESDARAKVARGFQASVFHHWTKDSDMDQAFIKSLSSEDRATVAKAMQAREATWQKAAAILGVSAYRKNH